MNVPLLDLQPQMTRFRSEILQAVTEVIDSTRYILGPKVTVLEENIARYCRTKFGVGVSSGTDALLASLMAFDIGPGDKVITTPYTFFATMGSILRVGATPVFADIEASTMNIDPEHMEHLLEKDAKEEGRVKAIMPVHLFGQCADMQRIMSLARQYNVHVIEDAAQAIGADCPFIDGDEVHWKRAGSMGATGCFSFFPSKNLGCIGDGGMVTTSDRELAEVLRSCRNHGAKPKYYHARIGGNFRLDPVQATVLSIKLPHLEKWHRQRRKNSDIYRQLFADLGLAGDPVILPIAAYQDVPGSDSRNHHIYNQFVIRVAKRDELRDYLREHSIGCEIYYPLCLHQQECLAPYGLGGQSFPVAEKAATESLALPIYPELTPEQLAYVAENIGDFYRSR